MVYIVYIFFYLINLGTPTQIEDWLLLGSSYNAESKDIREKYNIKYVLNVAEECKVIKGAADVDGYKKY